MSKSVNTNKQASYFKNNFYIFQDKKKPFTSVHSKVTLVVVISTIFGFSGVWQTAKKKVNRSLCSTVDFYQMKKLLKYQLQSFGLFYDR